MATAAATADSKGFIKYIFVRSYVAVSYVTDKFDDRVVELLRDGAVGLLPSDTIYGLSCRALDKAAVERIHKLKGRDSNKPLIVLIADTKMLDLLSISGNQAKQVEPYWPGAISLEFQAPSSPHWLHRGFKHFAIRVPDYPELRDLIRQVGPIVSTSANLQGQQPVASVAAAQEFFGDKLDFYVDVGELDNPPSTLAILENGRLKTVRQGAVKIEDRSNL
ncbi:MAG TPA: L-threonylcarbamoyladenylate synthase [Candidatus Saccharimonadales bacterium]|nr:L-threonylcarbamoyladenylate synthase [Candidatus Saccharimonadales bacterium]